MNVESLAERDKNVCHLCRQFVSRVERSQDHIVPKSAGGYNKSSNIKLAHRKCNNRRGSLPVELAYAALEAFEAEHGHWPLRHDVYEVLGKRLSEWVKANPAVAYPNRIKSEKSVLQDLGWRQREAGHVYVEWDEEKGRFVEYRWNHW